MNTLRSGISLVRRPRVAPAPSTEVAPPVPALATARATIVAHIWPSDHSAQRDVRFHFYDMAEAEKNMPMIHRILEMYASAINYNAENHHTQAIILNLLIGVMKKKFVENGLNIRWIEFH